jgi:hypothetical protein
MDGFELMHAPTIELPVIVHQPLYARVPLPHVRRQAGWRRRLIRLRGCLGNHNLAD